MDGKPTPSTPSIIFVAATGWQNLRGGDMPPLRGKRVDIERFREVVSRLENESAISPGHYRARVAMLTLLGFGILALLLATASLGLLIVVGLVVAVVLSGGGVLLLLLKLGKLLAFLVVPLLYLIHTTVRAFVARLPVPAGREVTRAEAPALFAALDTIRRQMRGPRFHHVLMVDDLNAAVVQRPVFGLVGWPRNYLLLGLPLLEAMPAAEALAVVAHEYGHLAGAHGRFAAYIYRLRLTWVTLHAHVEQISSWLRRPVIALVRWYVPYFNAYTFVLARAHEYQADTASARLVGVEQTASALKRVNTLAAQRQKFLKQAFNSVEHHAHPPGDLMTRWASVTVRSPEHADARRWLTAALDREGEIDDTHPTLRQRLTALVGNASASPPQAREGTSAAQDWFGPQLDVLRAELQSRWVGLVTPAWTERYADAQRARSSLAELRALAQPNDEQTLQTVKLVLRLEPETDMREQLAAFNASHVDHALGLFLEGRVRLEYGEHQGLDLLERAIALDPESTAPACECAHAYFSDGDTEVDATRLAHWQRRHAMLVLREHQMRNFTGRDELAPHGLDAATLDAIKSLLDARALQDVKQVFVARRVIPADPTAVQLVLAVELDEWARWLGRQHRVLRRLVAIQWPLPLLALTLDGELSPLHEKVLKVPGARLV